MSRSQHLSSVLYHLSSVLSITIPAMKEKQAYKIDRGQKSTVLYLAVLLAVAVTFSMTPALRYNILADPPAWVWAVLLIGLLQAAYVAWMAIVPDQVDHAGSDDSLRRRGRALRRGSRGRLGLAARSTPAPGPRPLA